MQFDIEKTVQLSMTEDETRSLIWLIQNWRSGIEACPDYVQTFLQEADEKLKTELPNPL